MINPDYIPPRITPTVDDATIRRQIANSSANMQGFSFSIADSTILVLAVEVPREWSSEEYAAWLAQQAAGAPADSQPTIQMLRVCSPAEVHSEDTCTLHVTTHPRLSAKAS